MTTEASAPPSSPATAVDIPTVVAGLRKTFAPGRTRDVAWRRQQLEACERMVVDNEAAIADALAQDLGRKPFEAWLADIASTAGEAARRGQERRQVDEAQAPAVWSSRSCPAAAGSSTSRSARCWSSVRGTFRSR